MITTYVLLTLISIAIIIAAVILGKKLRDRKDASDAKKAALEEKNDAV